MVDKDIGLALGKSLDNGQQQKQTKERYPEHVNNHLQPK
jgi:hypothetical protein